jgi:hypothetical protein
LKKGYEYVKGRLGEEAARRLYITNPQAAVEGEPLPAQPEPVGLRENVPLKFDISRYRPKGGGKSSSNGKKSNGGSSRSGIRVLWDALLGKN